VYYELHRTEPGYIKNKPFSSNNDNDYFKDLFRNVNMRNKPLKNVTERMFNTNRNSAKIAKNSKFADLEKLLKTTSSSSLISLEDPKAKLQKSKDEEENVENK
jgi:hypothetical protein